MSKSARLPIIKAKGEKDGKPSKDIMNFFDKKTYEQLNTRKESDMVKQQEKQKFEEMKKEFLEHGIFPDSDSSFEYYYDPKLK